LDNSDNRMVYVDCYTNKIILMFLLITGSKIKGYLYLRRLCKDIGLDFFEVKEKLPIKQGNFEIIEIEVNEKL